jgi:hypothetical protein
MPWFENLPWWAKAPLIIGGALMSAFSNSFPQGFQTAGLVLGVAMALFGCVAVGWHFVRSEVTTRFMFQWPIPRRATRDMTMTEAFHMLNEAGEYPAFEEPLRQALYDGVVLAWGRRQLGRFAEDGRGPYHLIERDFWLTGCLEWITIMAGETERATHKDQEDYLEIRFNSKQIIKLAARIMKRGS